MNHGYDSGYSDPTASDSSNQGWDGDSSDPGSSDSGAGVSEEEEAAGILMEMHRADAELQDN
ncbi:hypothetical protein B0A55_04121 [Friedmanniomyces simplex]|uniref:Uncharacterized protein n=1 Tax=Friedmanniomyces simplex TaxID=329884 RepID=A0A4U0XSW1_9PEZI|nr:hypothetical protein B0A55_04121 [Friedmanniomyces simplex]